MLVFSAFGRLELRILAADEKHSDMRWMLVPPPGEDSIARTRHLITDLVHLDILTRVGTSYYYIAVHDFSLALCRFSRGTVAVFSEIIDHEVHGIRDDDLREAVAGQEPVYTGVYRLSAYIEQILQAAHVMHPHARTSASRHSGNNAG